MNSSNGNTRNWICSRALRTRQTVALVISTCALALGAFTASAAPDRVTLRYVSATNTVETIDSGTHPNQEASSARQPLQPHHGGPSAPTYSLAGQVVVLFLRARYLSDGGLGVH